jgi:hypothetical protein
MAIVTQFVKINSLFNSPKNTQCGEVEWLVEFELPTPAQDDGWIVQQIIRTYHIKDGNGKVVDPKLNGTQPTFWEAWAVNKGSKYTQTRFLQNPDGRAYDDVFDQPNRGLWKGTFKVEALAKFFQVNPLPTDFIQNNPLTQAKTLHSTTTKPWFWDDTGTPRTLTATWDCTIGTKNVDTKITALLIGYPHPPKRPQRL